MNMLYEGLGSITVDCGDTVVLTVILVESFEHHPYGDGTAAERILEPDPNSIRLYYNCQPTTEEYLQKHVFPDEDIDRIIEELVTEACGNTQPYEGEL